MFNKSAKQLLVDLFIGYLEMTLNIQLVEIKNKMFLVGSKIESYQGIINNF